MRKRLPEPWRRRISLALGGLTALVVIGLALRWEDVWLRWCRGRAAEACLDPAFGTGEALLGPHWVALFNAGEAAYPHLAALLHHPRRLVWQRAATAIDAWDHGGAAFASYLQRTDRLAALRYTFGEPCQHESDNAHREWRVDTPWNRWTAASLGIWTGSIGDHLEPSDTAIDDLEGMVLAPHEGSCPDAGIRAVRALTAMLRPGEADAPASPHAARIRELLERVASSDLDADLRLQAIHGLLFRSALAARSAADVAPFTAVRLFAWWEMATAVRYGPRLDAGTPEERVPGVTPERWEAARRALSHPWALAALAHLDHPSALVIVERLRSEASWREEIDRILEQPPPIARLRFPCWRPLAEAVTRFLGAGPEERRIASALAAELGLRELAPRLTRLVTELTDAEERLFHEATLVALGEGDRYTDPVRATMRRRASKEQAVPHPIVEARAPFSMFLPHLVRCLLFAGDLETLRQVTAEKLPWRGHLEDHLEGLPRTFQHCERYWLRTFATATLTKSAGSWECQRRLTAWPGWATPTVVWDSARRKFLLIGVEK